MTAAVRVKTAGERSIERRHPWLFSGALAKVEGKPGKGETIAVKDSSGKMLGWGAYSPQSQIAVRMWSFSPQQTVDRVFFTERFRAAIAMREQRLSPVAQRACRLVYGESDGFPGLIVDRYGDYLVMQCLSAGAEYWKPIWCEILQELLPLKGIYERSDSDVRKKEGLEPTMGLLAGEKPPEALEIEENGMRYLVDIYEGHKTGFYLDQRANRAQLRSFAKDAEVLNCFAYTGGFGLAALSGGAKHVTQIEASGKALEVARKHVELNGFDASRSTLTEGDVFAELRRLQKEQRSFDVIVLDPPKFAESKSQLERASRGYKDINLQAFKLLRPGGLLLTFSCSGQMTTPLFQKIVADAALDARRDGQILLRLEQDVDHPTRLAFPEGTYLKGLVCRVE
ncbi:MAG: class I SAM-dependent methyltransferase [Myxococcales bacterium]|nr:class I SAM-dependent methyltransferase [Myxococcales bacterium]MCB9644082.1 class I SAM-dependent methyltransferase [Myxococcales bacterium]